MKILIFGVTGMLGNAVFHKLSEDNALTVYGTVRRKAGFKYFPEKFKTQLVEGVDVNNFDKLESVIEKIRPDVVVNCIGLVKQLKEADDPLQAIPINALLPHQLASLCAKYDARLIHISTDCVFSGAKGNYVESDFSDAYDLYGRSKFLGEVDYPNAITLRTSIIGHELSGQRSLVNWFLSQEQAIKGYTKAIFSGLPTVEIANIIHDQVIAKPTLRGLYHVAAQPISKYDLLSLIANTYNKKIDIIPSDAVVIDRSLNAQKFNRETGYVPPEWPGLIERMFEYKDIVGG